MSFWAKVKEFLADEPIYADRPSNEALVEGWRIAYGQQKDRADLAEKRLEAVAELAEAYFNSGSQQVGIDFKTILTMTKEELEDNGDD